MRNEVFKDYYQILQVHYDASPDVIKAAYRKLCTIYHPDTSKNQNEDARMMDINEAYRVLGNSTTRTEYHKKWLMHFTDRSSNVSSITFSDKGLLSASPKDVLDQFFHALLTKNWNNAYACLTIEDQARISLNDFSSWKNAVSSCYEMQDYRIQLYRNYNKCRIEDTIYPQVTEFAVTINDMDLQTSKTDQSISHKYVAYDGNSWKVCLGLRSVKQATLKFKLLAQRRQNYDPVTMYNNAVSRTDPLTGLLSEKGFYDEAFKEVERHKRYNNPLSFVAFQINCDSPNREISCLCQCASILKTNSRINDILGRFGHNQILCILVETNQDRAMLAVNKFVTAVKRRQSEQFDVNAAIMEYDSYHSIEDTVFALCSDVSKNNNTIKMNKSNF
ncbi:MAG: DnaJ domain-containing protein [Lachnospiraceae bacterium]|nr:DnaJ domain-containing protein [Lachnospiraceae bacterium]